MEMRNLTFWKRLGARLFHPEVSVAIMAAVVCLLVIFPGTKLFDTMFHLGRVDALAEHFLAGGGYPCRLYATACAGFGYASPLFYGDLFLLPVALLRACGASMEVCFGALFAEQVVLAFGVMYGACRWFGLRARECLACACFFLFAPSTMMMIFSYGQIGMAVATAFLPCVVFPTLELLTEWGATPRRLWEAAFLLVLGMSACILSHVITAVLAVSFIAILCLSRLLFLLREPRRLACLTFAAVATLGLTAWFWVPMLEQRAAVALFVFSDAWRTESVVRVYPLLGVFTDTFIWQRGIYPILAAYCPEGWGWMLEWGRMDFDSFAAWGWLLLPLLWLLFRKGTLARFGEAPLWARVAGWGLLGLTVFVAMPLALGVLEPLLWWTQFPSRFFGLWTCLLAPLAVCFAFRRCTPYQRRLLTVAFLVMFLVVCVFPLYARRCYLPDLGIGRCLPPVSEELYGIGKGEYLPERFTRIHGGKVPKDEEKDARPWRWRDNAFDGAGPFTLEVTTPQTSVTVPLFYYKGYAATMDGEPIPIRESFDGMVEAETAGKTGTLRVWYAGTFLQRASGWFSFGVLLLLLLLFFFRHRLRIFATSRVTPPNPAS